ncbi:MAG: hypothetical protein ACD_75C00196G0002 [uncultured bacterium]|nr:MAG: hypothetical protein ACD_75C00196G0002 [uncultured bacterium]
MIYLGVPLNEIGLIIYATEYLPPVPIKLPKNLIRSDMKQPCPKTLTFLVLALLLPVLANAAEIIKNDLGTRDVSFGSAGQAAAMLKLIDDRPHQRQYQISYKTETDTVFFEFDIAIDTIVRIHKRKNGTGTVEKWQGDALYRLQAAVKGGTLNDTKKGKSAGTMTNF